MRTIERTGQFKRDFKRETKGSHRETLQREFADIAKILTADRQMNEKYRDHALTGEWQDCRDCHAKPDLVLIYRKQGSDVLQLVRPGSHSELGL